MEVRVAEYKVGIKKLSNRPLVGPGGELTHEVVYSISSSDGTFSTDWNGGVVQGETLTRCLQLQEKGYVAVLEPTGWGSERPEQWQEVIINMALDSSKSESA